MPDDAAAASDFVSAHCAGTGSAWYLTRLTQVGQMLRDVQEERAGRETARTRARLRRGS